MGNELLKKYLANELSLDERNAFEQEMENDSFLKESIEGLEAQGIFKSGNNLEALENDLNKRINSKIDKTKKTKLFPIHLFRISIAACFIGILCFIGWNSFLNKKQFDEQAVYASYFKPLTHPDATVRGEIEKNNETSAIQAYEKEDYFEAVKLYEKLVTFNPANIKNSLFLGISYLATNQTQKAIDILKKIDTSTEYSDDIQWYLALAYIKNKESENALLKLTVLTKTENYYQKQAKEIIEIFDKKLAMKD